MSKSKSQTLYAVFIIESLRKSDYKDGRTLGDILTLSNILKMYRYVNSKPAFLKAIEEFDKSTFRYLHLSCHADMTGIEVGGKVITNVELAKILKGKIVNRRLFVSACEASNRHMATLVITRSAGQSVIGSPVTLGFDKSAVFWPSFYQAIKNIDERKMNRESLGIILERCVNFFEVPINYYCASKKGSMFLKRHKFRFNKKPKIETITSIKNL